MSFTKEKKTAIQNYLLEKIASGDHGIAKKTAEAFDTSPNTVYRYLTELEKNGCIRREGNDRYRLISQQIHFSLLRKKNQLVYEDEIYREYFEEHIRNLPENAVRIWSYGISEMINNVIDHSKAKVMVCDIYTNKMETTIIIHDDGVGIFKHIKEFYEFRSLMEAVQELFKGKLTTDAANHSGEGIFFTSRMMDFFAALSDSLIFTHDNFQEAITEIASIPGLENWEQMKGTLIVMSLSNATQKTPAEIFRKFEDEDMNFSKTNIKISHLFGSFPVSRSQAKRLCRGLEAFSEVTLDFSGVDEIGQGFAHEVFAVYQADHPELKIIAENTNETVDRMLKHVSRH